MGRFTGVPSLSLGLEIDIDEQDVEAAKAALRAGRRAIDQQFRQAIVRTAEATILPAVRAEAPSVVRSALVVRGTTRRGYITTQGARVYDRIAGLLNWGGVVSTQIRPKGEPDGRGGRPDALTIAPGVLRARVRSPRRYEGKRYIERGIERGLPEYTSQLTDEILTSFRGLDTEREY